MSYDCFLLSCIALLPALSLAHSRCSLADIAGGDKLFTIWYSSSGKPTSCLGEVSFRRCSHLTAAVLVDSNTVVKAPVRYQGSQTSCHPSGSATLSVPPSPPGAYRTAATPGGLAPAKSYPPRLFLAVRCYTKTSP